MRPKIIALLMLSVVVLALTSSVSAQEPTVGPGPKASIEDLKWISGHWNGAAMGGRFEETWNPPAGGAMMGMFKFIEDGNIKFYELLTIVPQSDSLSLRLKHFDNQLVGWEEKDKSVEFPLVAISEIEARFEGLTFKKISADEILISVVVKQKDGSTQELRFECQRVGKTSPTGSNQAIDKVFELDSVLSKQRDRLTEQHSSAIAVQAYVLGLDSIDFSECPADFSQAFKKHRDAWNNTLAFFEKHDQMRGEMHAVIEKIRQMDQAVVAELDQRMSPVFETWQAVETAAKQRSGK